ncbi:cytochrome P450 94A1-like [Silene latifolia]|uniref:cytochrome P450 94A1-like n=1 Tax=Silene latifolia TaxID=37657 RepID=UPI003D776082
MISRPLGSEDECLLVAAWFGVEHILKTQHKVVFRDLFGDSVFTENGDAWKAQRQAIGVVFTHTALQKFAENIVSSEISDRLIPVLSDAAKENKVIDLQDLLKRFAFDNICEVSFGYNPGYVAPSMPDAKLVRAFDEALMLCHNRFHAIFPIIWKVCRFFNIGSEKRLSDFVQMLREFVKGIIESIQQNLETGIQETNNSTLSIFLKTGQFDEKLVIDMMISFIIAGQDTTSAALTWFKVISAAGDDFNPIYVPETTAKMHGGFPVRIEERVQVEPRDVN